MSTKINVFEDIIVTIKKIGAPEKDTFFNNNFRKVVFEKEDGTIFENSILDGRVYEELRKSRDLIRGHQVTLRVQVSPVYGWIKTINGKEWH